MKSLWGQHSEKGNCDLDNGSSKPSSSFLNSGRAPMPRLDKAPASSHRVPMLRFGAEGSWKGGPTSLHDSISQHPPSATGTLTVIGG